MSIHRIMSEFDRSPSASFHSASVDTNINIKCLYMDNEIFKLLKFNEDYQISNFGRLLSSVRGPARILKPNSNNGYLQYFLKVSDTESKWFYAHRLVGEYFVFNLNNWPEINHIDNDRSNNHYSNLEWTTRSLNQLHAFRAGRAKPKGNRLKGIEVSNNTRKLMSEAKLGELHPKFRGYYVFNGLRYASTKQAEQATMVTCKSILRWSKANKNGWRFECC